MKKILGYFKALIYDFIRAYLRTELDKLEIGFNAKINELSNEINLQISENKLLNEQLKEYQKTLKNVLGNIDVSVDIEPHKYSRSWAVISLQGEKTDFVKFVDLSYSDIKNIQLFLSQFDRNNQKVDCPANLKDFFRIKKQSL